MTKNYIKKAKATNYQIIKRLYLLVFAFLLFPNHSSAIIGNYGFTSAPGTYVPLVGGTVLVSGTWDDSSSALLTIPFSFNYNNLAYTTLGINANGFITMGGTSNAVYCGLQSSPGNSIAAYGTDLASAGASSSVKYGIMGTAPNRRYVIQWTACKHYGNSGDSYNFQIVLNESSNTVQVIWGNVTSASTMGPNNCAAIAGESGDIGLLGNSTLDFNIRKITNGTNTWQTSVAGNAINAVGNMSPSNFPSSGLTYTWTPAVPTPMVFTSCTTTFVNNNQNVPRGMTNDPVIRVEVLVTGSLSPFGVSNLALSTAGCTNPTADLLSAKVFFTGGSNVFTPSGQFGTTVNSPNGAYTVNGAATLVEGYNFFWITYNATNTAIFGDILKGCCTQITGSGTMGVITPAVTCPAGIQTIVDQGLWTKVTANAPHDNHGVMLLLSDGSVMCHTNSGGADGNGTLWDKLTPDASGSYINGTWTTTAPMSDTRLFFSTQVLKDGRVYVAGGEYGTGGSKAEVYNPVTNTWTAPLTSASNISDANSEILEDGRVLQALVSGSLDGTSIYNPATNTFSPGPSSIGIHNESAWLKLPDHSILFVDRESTNSERYIPASNTWIADANVPVDLYDTFGDETGGALLLPDGRAFFVGSLGATAFYTPSGTTAPGTWAAGPMLPNSSGAPDAPMTMMSNGRVLCAVSPAPTSNQTVFTSPTTFYEFDYLTNSFAQINAPSAGLSINIGSYQTNFLDLPDGSVLYAQNQSNSSSSYYVYRPNGSPTVAGKPTISGITQTACNTFQITGTKFNGISEGASYGDDWQMATNYPLVRLTNGTNVYYCRTSNWNSTGVNRGNLPDSAQFVPPPGLPQGIYSLVVTANGIASNPVSFTYSPTNSIVLSATSSGTASQTICLSQSIINITYNTTGAAVPTFSGLPAGVNGSFASNVATISGTPTVPGIYNYTVSMTDSCGTATATGTLTVNKAPTITCSANQTANTGATGCTAVATYAPSAITGFPAPTMTYAFSGATSGSGSGTGSGSAFNTGITTVQLIAQNSCGMTVCSFTVTVTDNINPTITAPAQVHVTTNIAGAATGVNIGTPTTADNCAVASVTNNHPSTTYPLGTTIVIWTVTDANGNTATTNQTVVVTDALSASASGQTNVSCNGGSDGSATVAVSGGTLPYAYSWSPSGGSASTATGLAMGTYTVTVTDASGMGYIATQSFSITEPAAISITSQPSDTTIATGANTSFTVNATNGSTYQWQVSTNAGTNWTNLADGGGNPTYSGASTPTLNLMVVGSNNNGYKYRVLVGNGTCTLMSNEALLNVTALIATTTFQAGALSVYPNPSSDVVFIDIPAASSYSNLKVVVYDMTGRALLSRVLNSDSSRIDISALPAQVYLFKISSDGNTGVRLIVKK